MKRFLAEIKIEDLLFIGKDKLDLDVFCEGLELPAPLLEGDNFRINIIFDEKLNQIIEKASRYLLSNLVEGKAAPDLKNVQTVIKDRFVEIQGSKPEWLIIQAFEFLILFRESLYRLTLQLQKSQKKLSPLERKSLRFHAGLTVSKMFESVFLYQLPYHIQGRDFTSFTSLFNPLILSGSFPEYFLSDYFCFLEIKNPVWTKDRFSEYRSLLLESASHGLSSFIGVALTSRGVALQKIYRLIRTRYSDFNENTAENIVDKLQDDSQFFKETLKHREIRKVYLSGVLPKNLSKNDFLNRLEEDFAIFASQLPFSRFLQHALEAEILRKILNNIVLIDRHEYPKGFGELISDYTLYMTILPYIYRSTDMEKKAAKEMQTAISEAGLEDNERVDELEETVRINFDDLASILQSPHGTAASGMDEIVGTGSDRHALAVGNNSESMEDAVFAALTARNRKREKKDYPDDDSQGSIEQLIDEARQEISEVQPGNAPADSDKTEGDHETAHLDQDSVSHHEAVADSSDGEQNFASNYESPYLLGMISLAPGESVCFREAASGDFYSLEEVKPQEASFKIVMGDELPRFMVNKSSPWHKPTPLKSSPWGGWEATIQRKESNDVFHFYLEPHSEVEEQGFDSTISAEDGEIVATPASVDDPVTETGDSQTKSSGSTDAAQDEFEDLSSAELSQALLDGLIDFNRYNEIIEQRSAGQKVPVVMEEPDIVLEQGINWCTDWQGRITSSSEKDSDIRLHLTGAHFRLDLKKQGQWVAVYDHQAVPAEGFTGTFTKTVLFSDPSSNDSSPEKISKEYSFFIIQLIGETYGLKFL